MISTLLYNGPTICLCNFSPAEVLWRMCVNVQCVILYVLSKLFVISWILTHLFKQVALGTSVT